MTINNIKYALTLTLTLTLLSCGSSKKAAKDNISIAKTEAQADAAKQNGTNDDIDNFTPSAAANHLAWPQNMQRSLDEYIAQSRLLKTSQLGLMVYDLTDDKVLYNHNAEQAMRPASTMKVITAVTALDKLGNYYTYKTRLKYTGEVVDSIRTLKGNLYLVGTMDPMIDRSDLQAMVRSLKSLGVDTIRGAIFTDKSMKDSNLLGEGWCWDDDNPELSALVYNRKDNMLEHFLSVLSEEKIYFNGYTGEYTCPISATEACVRTHTLQQVLTPMLKKSDNLYAESVYYQMAYATGGPATAKKAQALEREIIRKMGKENISYRLADGSGLSLYNYVTAELEVTFLRYAYRHKEIYNTLYPTLPIAASDGTLKSRMAGTKAAWNVHAKTGTVTGISSLCGYCTASNGHLLCFSILNQGIMSPSPGRAFQNKVCEIMCKY